ncbi:hypothetical protein CASFOL_033142 [Castilleja foliolosa]|uniref:Uncharacterized protein n=1 Tax=Castilleja foliolosa TaxID=1961234 RepID=A0ABD3C5D4_9LAMI
MDISGPNPSECNVLEQDAVVLEPSTVQFALSPPPAPPPLTPTPTPLFFNEDKVIVSVEVLLKPSSTARADDVCLAVERMMEKRFMSYSTVQSLFHWMILFLWIMLNEYVYAIQLSEEGPCEDISNDAQLASFN